MAQFEPYVFVQTSEKKPSSISNAAWTANQMKYINLDEGTDVRSAVQNHFKVKQGKCALYGDITGYRHVTSQTQSIVLDTEGNELRRENGDFWPKSISMEDEVTLAP